MPTMTDDEKSFLLDQWTRFEPAFDQLREQAKMQVEERFWVRPALNFLPFEHQRNGIAPARISRSGPHRTKYQEAYDSREGVLVSGAALSGDVATAGFFFDHRGDRKFKLVFRMSGEAPELAMVTTMLAPDNGPPVRSLSISRAPVSGMEALKAETYEYEAGRLVTIRRRGEQTARSGTLVFADDFEVSYDDEGEMTEIHGNPLNRASGDSPRLRVYPQG